VLQNLPSDPALSKKALIIFKSLLTKSTDKITKAEFLSYGKEFLSSLPVISLEEIVNKLANKKVITTVDSTTPHNGSDGSPKKDNHVHFDISGSTTNGNSPHTATSTTAAVVNSVATTLKPVTTAASSTPAPVAAIAARVIDLDDPAILTKDSSTVAMIESYCARHGVSYTDGEFPAADSSLFNAAAGHKSPVKPGKTVSWRRPGWVTDSLSYSLMTNILTSTNKLNNLISFQKLLIRSI